MVLSIICSIKEHKVFQLRIMYVVNCFGQTYTRYSTVAAHQWSCLLVIGKRVLVMTYD